MDNVKSIDKLIFSELMDLSRRGYVEITKKDNDEIFKLKSKDKFIRMNGLENINNKQIELYSSAEIPAYENLFVTKILFPFDDEMTKNDIFKKIKEGYYAERMEMCALAMEKMFVYFLEKNNMTNKSGNIILKDGTILGKHNGLYKYTIGQRKGLNIAYKEPLYVLELDTENNNVIIGTNNDLLKKELVATNINYLIDKDEFFKTKLYAKIRSRGALEEIDSCQLDNEKNLIITFVKEQ